MAWPSFTEPRPLGKPRPSGRTSMSQPAISSADAGLPKPYCKDAAAAGFENPQRNAEAQSRTQYPMAFLGVPAPLCGSTVTLEDLDIADLAGRVDAPGLDRVVVID